jgi:SAM-dependent methyltransferase
MQRPQIWHYGLVTRLWAEFVTEGGPEAAYYKGIIETYGQPALDLGCGSGRLLFPFLQAGLDVDGCDYSEDMIAVCRERAEKEGLSPRLYAQAMHELDLPQRYRTIYACGVIGIGGEWRLTMQAMQRCYEHLRPGGVFAFNHTVRWNDPPAWLSRLPENRRNLPEEWPESGERQRLPDGTELEEATRTVAVDPLENVATRQIRVRLWHEGELMKEEIHTQRLDDHSKNELVLMLERAGFSDLQVFGDFTDEAATADHEELIFVCRK